MSDDIADLADLVREVSRTLRRRTVAIAEPYGITAHQLRTLRLIEMGTKAGDAVVSPMRISDIAERLRIVARSATDVIDELERKGVVLRAPHPTDRRSTVVELTPEGRRMLDEVESQRRADAREYFAGLSAADRRALERILRLLHP